VVDDDYDGDGGAVHYLRPDGGDAGWGTCDSAANRICVPRPRRPSGPVRPNPPGRATTTMGTL